LIPAYRFLLESLEAEISELIPLREERTVVLMENARLREGAQLKELEKELSEVKDQNAALQSQLQEYVGVISDQSKVGTQHAYVPTTLCTLMCCHSTYTTPLPSFPSPFNSALCVSPPISMPFHPKT